jgi:hypothetical protein
MGHQRIQLGEQVHLATKLRDEDSNRYVRAEIYAAEDTELLESPVMPHTVLGAYDVLWTPNAIGYYRVVKNVYLSDQLDRDEGYLDVDVDTVQVVSGQSVELDAAVYAEIGRNLGVINTILPVADGTSDTITLDASAVDIDDWYNGTTIVVSSGTARESASIVDYDGTTKIATVSPAWKLIPVVGWDYVILPGQSTTLDATAIADAILDAETNGVGSDTVRTAFRVLLATAGKSNFRIDQMTYSANRLLTSARLRLFATRAAAEASTIDAAGAEGAFATIDLTETPHLTLPSRPRSVLALR